MTDRKPTLGTVQTVLGPISPSDLGPTMMHEHILVDLSPLFLLHPPTEATRLARMWAPLTIDLLGAIKYSGQPVLDNARLLDIETAIAEVSLFRRAGGATIVDPTCIGMGRDPAALARIARASGLNVVMGCSYYLDAMHPKYLNLQTEDQIMESVVQDVLHGVGHTGIRAGLIGEVGCSWPLTANERKVLRASGRAQLATGAPLMVHPGRDEAAPMEIIGVLREVETDLSRMIMCHIDRTIFDRKTLKRVAETGCVLEYDLFGHENSYYRPNPDIDMPNDAQRLREIFWLIEQGHGQQITISHDIASKQSLVRYGGCGYGHIMENIVPRMRRKGFKDADIQTILIDTPRRLLTFAK